MNKNNPNYDAKYAAIKKEFTIQALKVMEQSNITIEELASKIHQKTETIHQLFDEHDMTDVPIELLSRITSALGKELVIEFTPKAR